MNHDAATSPPKRLDVTAFAQGAEHLQGIDRLADYRRLGAEAVAPADAAGVGWSADGEMRGTPGGVRQPWLHLTAEATLPMTCQRCMEPVAVALSADRWFRFVADEATAEMEDEEAEEDVLAIDDALNLRELIEDELLLALPVVPMHAQCPVDVRSSAADAAFRDAAKPEHPFAALEQLRDKSKDR